MSLFGKILEKLGYKPADTPAAPASKPSAPAKASYPTGGAPKPVVARGPAPIRVVDVVGKPEGLAAKNPQKLDWKVSMVDLLKLLGLESSFEARKELAAELGCPADKMGDSASMNVWLHKTVLQKLADNGGNIPKELLS
jgi:hypothetical protein